MHLISVACRSDRSQDLVHGNVQPLRSYWRTLYKSVYGSDVTCKKFCHTEFMCFRKFCKQSFEKLVLKITRTRWIGNWTTWTLIFPSTIIQGYRSIGQICVRRISKYSEERINVIRTLLSHSDISTFMDGVDSMPALGKMGNLWEIRMQILSGCSLVWVWLDLWFSFLVLFSEVLFAMLKQNFYLGSHSVLQEGTWLSPGKSLSVGDCSAVHFPLSKNILIVHILF